MKMQIDTERQQVIIENSGTSRTVPLYSKESFEALSEVWLKVGWNEKHVYTFTWMGRPIIQLPEDALRMQEVIYTVKPDVIIETGVAHGGSLILYASLCKAMGKGRVVGIDIEIRAHNRKALEAHELFEYLTLIEGSSVAPEIVQRAKALIRTGETVLVILDSDHSRQHVVNELNAYAPLVTVGSYIVATDGSMQDLHDVPRGKDSWKTDNPVEAVKNFLASHPEFVQEQPAWRFNESELSRNITHWPMAYLKRIR
jgi:cephalosporin hydroxylase